jgi:predicted metal-binding protein
MKTKLCQHKFIYKPEVVKLHDVNEGWYSAKRIIIFCENCGKVSHDQTNDNSWGQDYKHKLIKLKKGE